MKRNLRFLNSLLLKAISFSRKKKMPFEVEGFSSQTVREDARGKRSEEGV